MNLNKNLKYTFDKKTLSYKPLVYTAKQRSRRLFFWLFSSSIFGVISYILFSMLIDSPKEKSLKREIQFLQLNYEQLAHKIDMSESILEKIQNRDNNIYRVLLEAEPNNIDVMKGGFGGVNRYEKLEGYNYSDIVKELSKRTDILNNKIYLQSKSLDTIVVLAKDKENMLNHIPAIQPVHDGLTRLASGYGERWHPILKHKKMHYGVDFAASIGAPIYATGDAKVKMAGFSAGFGKHVILDHGYGYETLYAHMNKIDVEKGQKIKRGQRLGEIGNTGLSSGPHLHYEVHKNGKRVNPINFYYKDLTPEEYNLMVEKSEESGQALD